MYVESLGDRLHVPLMRTHEDLSSDMELYVFYGFVVILYLVKYPGIYEIDYFTSIFGRSFNKEGKCPNVFIITLSDCM